MEKKAYEIPELDIRFFSESVYLADAVITEVEGESGQGIGGGTVATSTDVNEDEVIPGM